MISYNLGCKKAILSPRRPPPLVRSASPPSTTTTVRGGARLLSLLSTRRHRRRRPLAIFSETTSSSSRARPARVEEDYINRGTSICSLSQFVQQKMVSGLINANPIVYERKERQVQSAPIDIDQYADEPIDQQEIFDILLVHQILLEMCSAASGEHTKVLKRET
ncbi:uncharacterized protein [Elaeis guineensis]|uniref:Uncharacterized protein LOC105053814 isoform X3 n=1 Tax=Elaeis guineensis var. tenera TaxID=51953 RepID=A0A6J0PP54_ELAGV|nr:uncharacterized protein LOC105053814 isoform X3 [Elaeis guineensis]